MTRRFTVPLSGGSLEVGRVGGKAHGLGRLIEAGFRVPAGFCVTVEGFEQVVGECVGRAETLAELRAELREAPLPDEFEREVGRRIEEVGAERWAVRSSAVEEDTERFSFAGQQRTELDVEGIEQVLEAIRRVWADLYNIESLLYRERLRVDAVPRPMGVIVQAMVDASAGGVMFTQNPLAAMSEEESDGRGEILITASVGSGRAVVEGRAGENIVVDRATGRIRDESGGGVDETLDETQIRKLVELGRGIERAFGAPRDIEWAIGHPAGEQEAEPPVLYALQARPITTGPERDGGLVDGEVWSNVNVGEALPGVATPLTWSIIGKFSRRGFERAFGTLGLSVPDDYELVGSFRGRVYLNLTQFVSVASAIPILDPDVLFEVGGGGGVDLVREVAQERSPAEFLRHLPATILRVLLSQATMPAVAPLWSRYFSHRLEAFFDRQLEDETRQELTDRLDEIDWLFDRTGLITLTCSSNFLMSYVVMKKSLDWFGREVVRERERSLFGALEVQSAEPVLELLELTRLVRRNATVESVIREYPPEEALEILREAAGHGDEGAGAFVGRFESFLDRHGHRAPREAELSTPRWREGTGFVFEIVDNYLASDDLPEAAEYRRRWEESRREVDELLEEGFNSAVEPWFRLLLRWARSTARIREFMRSHVVETLDMYRHFALECGRRMEAAGELGRLEDVFYLRHDELRGWLHGAETASDRQRRQRRSTRAPDRHLALRAMVRRELVGALREMSDPPDTFVVRDGDLVDAREVRREGQAEETRQPAAEEVRTILEGLAGSPGRVTGPARVIEDPEADGRVEPGEILVAPYADVGWSPLFMTASAVVMGLGGPLSHACIVAREFGIPTVVNARGAADVIESGDRVTVDGDEGIVYVHRRMGDCPND